MSPSQFHALMERFDNFEDRFGTRLRRVEGTLAALTGGIVLIAFLISNGIIHIGD